MFGSKPHRPQAVAFDIIGTVFPLDPLKASLVASKLAETALETWFAAGLRDAFALAAAGDYKPFAEVLQGALVEVAAGEGRPMSEHEAADVVKRLQHLPARPEAAAAFARLRGAGVQVLALSNGAQAATRSLLQGAGLDALTDHVVSIDEVKRSKPCAEVYLHAAKVAGVKPGQLALVAAHAWDVNGARAAGLLTGYVAVKPFSRVMRAPNVEGGDLVSVAEALLALGD